jgi:hypothetical protein
MCDVRPSRWDDPFTPPWELVPIGAVGERHRAPVRGMVTRCRPTRWVGGDVLEVDLEDLTGSVQLIFFGRQHVGGVEVGRTLTAVGVAGRRHDRLTFLNPLIWLEAEAAAVEPAVERPETAAGVHA